MADFMGVVMFGLVGAGALVFVVVNWRRYQALVHCGARTSGLIVGAVADAENEPESIVVVFEDRRGVPHQIVSHSGMTNWGRRVGRPVTVVYDPARPEHARIHEDVRLQTWIGTVFGVVFCGIAVALAVHR